MEAQDGRPEQSPHCIVQKAPNNIPSGDKVGGYLSDRWLLSVG